ncbi:hypothetical protein OGAPHI_003804 [Ogataea philodendri]|uniref:Uncharacterized protein n=1 Tax=Ogataea philodendri TaxID=1378263 RepID=A0A9P8T574_9ASCO|nr:uncharacterized protein OGAPHI_003804 [Ogataea philodendri]KAH3665616.1 hypothetical protein OGAPHI_003804 [Ogataea philodendri]
MTRISLLLISESWSVSLTSLSSLVRSDGTSLLDWLGNQSVWNNGLWKSKVLSKVVDTFVSESVVVVLPRELGLDVSLGGQGLHGLDNVQVLGIDVIVLDFKVLLSDQDTL